MAATISNPAAPSRSPFRSHGSATSRSSRISRRPRFPSANALLLLPLVALLLSPAPLFPDCPFLRTPFPAPLFPGLPSALAAPMSVLDVFRPPCPLPPISGPPGGWQRWSDLATWGAAYRGSKDVPGVGSKAAVNVTVPCGTAVLLDVANVTLDTLHVHGWLKLLDDKPRLPRIQVRANFIIVTGRLTVGEKDKQFAAQALFTLTPNSGRQRREYIFTLYPPAEPAYPRPLGHKVLAVVGGQADLHGLPGPPSMPVWVRLNKTAIAGRKEIVVDGDVSSWPVGGEIAIASTSAKMDEAERALIAGVSPHPQGYLINLTTPLKFTHDGNPNAIPDGFGGAVDVRGEVGLLHRNIVIYGLHEPGKYELEGGHFMVFMTQTPQYIEGVQFAYMGQQGVLGRYPLHFHVCGQANQSHVVRKNAIVYSKQRCVVIHATSNMTIEDTVTYESKGHCFLVEEGSENNNVFRRNLGIAVRKVKVVIPSMESFDKHTDDKPSTFWMANPNNDYINNVAAGSDDSGYWTELKDKMRGLSQLLPNARDMCPVQTKFGTYTGNVAHSAKFGFRSYPHGMFPYAPGARVTLSNFLIYRNEVGMFLHITRLMTIQSSIFVDNGLSIHVKTDTGVVIDQCKFIGRTQNCTGGSRAKAASLTAVAAAAAAAASEATAAAEAAPVALPSPLGPLASTPLFPSTPLPSPTSPVPSRPISAVDADFGPTTDWQAPGLVGTDLDDRPGAAVPAPAKATAPGKAVAEAAGLGYEAQAWERFGGGGGEEEEGGREEGAVGEEGEAEPLDWVSQPVDPSLGLSVFDPLPTASINPHPTDSIDPHPTGSIDPHPTDSIDLDPTESIDRSSSGNSGSGSDSGSRNEGGRRRGGSWGRIRRGRKGRMLLGGMFVWNNLGKQQQQQQQLQHMGVQQILSDLEHMHVGHRHHVAKHVHQGGQHGLKGHHVHVEEALGLPHRWGKNGAMLGGHRSSSSSSNGGGGGGGGSSSNSNEAFIAGASFESSNRGSSSSISSSSSRGYVQSTGSSSGSYIDRYNSGSSSSSSSSNNILASSTSQYYFGSFEAPLGVVITQISPRDLLEPNKITNSWFSSFGTCRAASPAIMLTTNPYGGFWTPSSAVEGLRFAKDTNRLWASPNPATGYIRSGAQLANFYALWDLDGSLLGSSTTTTTSSSSTAKTASTANGFGFAVAPFDPVLPPPSLRTTSSFACSYQPAWSVHSCTGPAACFRSFALFYNESVTKDQTANLSKDQRRPYSYVTFTRLQDNATFTSVGSDNDYDDDFSRRYGGERQLLRQVTATLLAGFSYRVSIQPSEVGPGFFYPTAVQLQMLDVGGCEGGLTVIMDTPPKSQDMQWRVVSNNPEAPCPGTPVNPSIAYTRSMCISGKPMLAFDIGSTAIRSIARIELTKSSGGTACPTARCFMSPRRFEGLD
ncbi:hypothetical protein CLOM_g10985 [Closterium sp. NIES-68]|nr:hypothetical protein CLOM_g10985 [Closterium sp. NIES-68]